MNVVTAWFLGGFVAPMTVFLCWCWFFPPRIRHHWRFGPALWTAREVRALPPAEVPARKQLER